MAASLSTTRRSCNIVNNTIAKNITTATAVTSDGAPAPAGLSTAANSDQLQARLANTTLFSGSATLASTLFSKPTLLNNIFNDNRAGSFVGGWVYGIGGDLPDGSANTTNNWDMGVVDVPGALLSPRNSVLQTTTGTDYGAAGTTNTLAADAGFKTAYDVSVNILSFRTYPAFRQAVIVAELLPPNLMGDYHLGSTASPARGAGAASTFVRWGPGTTGFTYTVSAPTSDIDGQARPTAVRYDAGADQFIP